MSDNKLHLIPVLEKGQTYNAALASIVLSNAGYFSVTIKEYQEDEKKIKELEKKKEAAKNFAIDKWEANEKKGWGQKKLKEEYEQDIQEYSKLEAQVQKYKEKYNDVNWCWQLAGKKIIPNNLSHNDSFSKGIYQIKNTGKQSVLFPKFLIGGGVSWIEAFHENEGPVGQTPYGLCVQAYGIPEIARIEWTDIERNPITQKIGFNSKVILHIYTTALYGQELEIKLTDKNSLVSPKNKAFSEAPAFERQVNIRKLNKRDIGKKGVSGLLTKEGQNNVAEQEYYTQKIEIEIVIEEAWDMHNGTILSIFPAIKSLETDVYFKEFEGVPLDVVSYKEVITSVQQVSNKPVLIATIETNVAHYNHCRYDKIELKKQDKSGSVVLFDSAKNAHRELKTIPVEIVVGKKETYLLDFDFETKECEQKPVKHINEELTLISVPKDYEVKIDSSSKAEHKIKKEEKKLIKTESTRDSSIMGMKTKQNEIIPVEKGIVTVRQKQIEFDAFYNYDIPQDANAVTTFIKAVRYIWLHDLSADKINRINAFAATCALQQNIHIAIYPDIKWTLKFGFNVTKDDIEKLNKKGGTFAPLKTYQDRAQEKEDDYFEKNKSRKETKDRAEKYFSEKYDLKRRDLPAAPVDKGTKFKQIIEIVKNIKISLEEQHYGGAVKNELTDEFVKQFYEQIRPIGILIGKAIGIIDGDYDKKEFTPGEEKDIDGLMAKFNRKPVKYEMLYPKISCAGSWYFQEIDAKQYPEFAGRQGLGVDLILKTAPLIGVSIKWDILELLCRRHPIAYAVLKAVDGLIYILADDPSAVTCDFIVSGQIDSTVNLQLNCLAGFKDFNVKGKSGIKAEIILELKLNNSMKLGKFEILAKRDLSTGASIGLGIEDLYGIDNNGIYIKKDLVFEGIKFSFKAEGSIELAKKERKRRENMVKLGGKVSGEITMLAHTFSTNKIYLNKTLQS